VCSAEKIFMRWDTSKNREEKPLALVVPDGILTPNTCVLKLRQHPCEGTPMLILVTNRSIVMGEKTSENPFRTPFSDIFSPMTIEGLIIPKTSLTGTINYSEKCLVKFLRFFRKIITVVTWWSIRIGFDHHVTWDNISEKKSYSIFLRK